MSEHKNKVGRPVGKKINWSGLVWHSMTNAQIAAKVGTTVPNVWMKRNRMLKEGKKVAYQGKKYTHYQNTPAAKKRARKTAKLAVTPAPAQSPVA